MKMPRFNVMLLNLRCPGIFILWYSGLAPSLLVFNNIIGNIKTAYIGKAYARATPVNLEVKLWEAGNLPYNSLFI